MTLNDLLAKLSEVQMDAEKLNLNPIVMMRVPGELHFVPVKLTRTYISQSLNGTTKYEQVPCVLIEEDENG